MRFYVVNVQLIHWIPFKIKAFCFDTRNIYGLFFRTYGTLSVTADKKWKYLFDHCKGLIGCHDDKAIKSEKAWEALKKTLAANKLAIKAANK